MKIGKCIDDEDVVPSICIFVCSRLREPLCGVDSNGDMKRFSNECEMRRENCINNTGLKKIKIVKGTVHCS